MFCKKSLFLVIKVQSDTSPVTVFVRHTGVRVGKRNGLPLFFVCFCFSFGGWGKLGEGIVKSVV